MVEIKKIDSPNKKADICNLILRALPNWFGVEASILEYVESVKTMPFWASLDADKTIGFVALKEHNTYASELCVMGVLPEYHRAGIGKRLIECCEEHCLNNDTEYLTVKTLDASALSKSYAKTREFYLAMGFRPLEVFPLHWDEKNPCLFMAKRV